jgi:hypothetical protein
VCGVVQLTLEDQATKDVILFQDQARMCKVLTASLADPYSLYMPLMNKAKSRQKCSLHSRRGLVQEDKRTVLAYTHGLFIT